MKQRRTYTMTPDARAQAKARRKESNRSHKALVATILEFLALKGIPATESDTGAVFMGGRPVKRATGRKGWPDVTAILPPSGLFVGIEAKTGEGKLSPEQKACHADIAKAGGRVVVARSLDDVMNTLGKPL